MSMGAAAGPPSGGKGPSAAPKLASALKPKKFDWKLPHASPSASAVAKKPFSRMAAKPKLAEALTFGDAYPSDNDQLVVVRDGNGKSQGRAAPRVAKVASLAMACGLDSYQVESAVYLGGAMAKRSNLLAKGLLVGGVGAGLYAGKKAIDKTQSMAMKRHDQPHRIGKVRQTPGVMGRRATSGGY